MLVEVENVSKVYRKGTQEVPVLRELNLGVGAGEFVALMGPSGSGKTTLLNLIAGIDRPTSGTIRVDGVDLAGAAMLEHMVLQPQQRNLRLEFAALDFSAPQRH